MRDSYNREIDYMRISITDRCNLRCRYCMPSCGIDTVPLEEILTYEEITGICREAVKLGINKFRITGGEPLVRKNAPELIGMIKRINGVSSIGLTTNGILLEDSLTELVKNGLDAVNISLDTVNRDRYAEITGSDCIDRVFSGINAALDSGINVKINSVLADGDSYRGIIELAREWNICVRFIELMPLGNAEKTAGISYEDVYKYIRENIGEIYEDATVYGNGPARYIRIKNYSGVIGFISPIHNSFCDSCNRIRLTSTGKVKLCLCYGDAYDVRTPLREGDMDKVRQILTKSILSKPKSHCFDELVNISEKQKMVSIGG